MPSASKIVLSLAVFFSWQQCQAFVISPCSIEVTKSQASLNMARTCNPSTSALLAKPPKKDIKSNAGTNEVDYGAIAGMLVNPTNPYSWFLYFFVGINVYSALSQ